MTFVVSTYVKVLFSTLNRYINDNFQSKIITINVYAKYRVHKFIFLFLEQPKNKHNEIVAKLGWVDGGVLCCVV